jgi:hypothetical protein
VSQAAAAAPAVSQAAAAAPAVSQAAAAAAAEKKEEKKNGRAGRPNYTAGAVGCMETLFRKNACAFLLVVLPSFLR